MDILHCDTTESEFRGIELENGLSAVLVSDPSCQEDLPLPAAVSLAVRIGSFCDPPVQGVQGLSHLLEHMLFQGSTKFGLSYFNMFLAAHGGSANAFTEREFTIFHLHVKPDSLETTLDRFSDFLIAPLLDPKLLKKEICAIDSEFNMSKENNFNLIEELMAHTSKKGHIFNRFCWGNKESLTNANLHEHLKKLFDEGFVGGAMKLCVIGGEELDTLERWVRQYFGPIKKGPPKTIHIPAFNIREPIWDASISYGLQIKNGHILQISWILPPLSPNFYLERPEQYLVKLLNQQGKGSLFAFFKNEGWANSLSVVPFDGSNCTSVGRLFTISMDLTLSGLEKRYELISYTYQYLKLVRDATPQKWVMDEFWKIKKMQYDNEVHSYPVDFAKRISGNMLLYPMAHVIRADYLSNWNPKAIRDLMTYFTPERMRIDFASESVKGTDLKIEPWFKSRYREEQIPASFKEAWSSSSSELIHASLCFPSPNKFIPTSFEARGFKAIMQHPIRIVDTSSLNMLYCCKDQELSFLYLLIYHKGGYSSVENHLMMRLFTELLKGEVEDILYQSHEAGLSSSITLHGDQLLLKVSGYWEKLNLWLSDIWNSFMTFSLTTKDFEIMKEKIKTEMSNMNTYRLSNYLLYQILSGQPYSMRKTMQVLNDISFAGLEQFVHVMRSEIFIEGICFGEMSYDEAMEIANVFQTLPVMPLPKDVRHKNRIIRLQTKIRKINVKVSNRNSAIQLYFQIGREEKGSVRKRATIDVFCELIREMLFDQLRNEEQLGYVVECSRHLMCGVLGFSISVVSAEYDPAYLFKRVSKFVNLIGVLLGRIPNESFKGYKDGVIEKLETIGKRFDSYSKIVREIRRIKKRHILKWYKEEFRFCHRIALFLWGSETKMKRNGLRHVKIPKVLKLSSTRLPQMTFKKVKKLVT